MFGVDIVDVQWITLVQLAPFHKNTHVIRDLLKISEAKDVNKRFNYQSQDLKNVMQILRARGDEDTPMLY